MRIIAVLIVAYVLSVAVVFAGMILTPTESSRKQDARTRERNDIRSFDAEVSYLVAKFYVAAIWPWFYITSFFRS